MRSVFVVVVLIATLVHQGTAQLPFGPVFHLSQYLTSEGGQLVVRLSASILTSSPITFTGSIEVDIAAEDISAELGSDYIVNPQSPLTRIFVVSFQSSQANSTEHLILISDDDAFEGRETFRLRIVETRFLGQVATVFRAQGRLNETTADVIIEDNDYIEVNWTISEPIEVTEGDGVEVRLRAEAFGIYANPIQIGVICAPTQVTGVPAASLSGDFTFTPGTSITFTDVYTIRSFSIEELALPIINDDIAEPCESFICTLQGGALDAVRGIEPNRVTIRICDDDALIVRWAQDVYEFTESQLATVELVTNSTFEVAQVRIQGFPRQIPDGDPNRLPSLVVPGPAFVGFSFNATIERVTSPKIGGNFGNAQVAQSGRPDVVSTINDFLFTPASQSAFESFTIVNDSVLEFDELFIAEFNFGPEIANTWKAIKGEPSTTFIVIRDDDSVVVNFNEGSYTVEENAGQVSVSLRIDGKFFYPVWVIVEITDGTATDPDDYSSARSYNVTFRQTAFTDGEDPADTALSSPILIDIVSDDVFEGVEYFQARIVETSDEVRVRIGQDTVNVTINDDDNDDDVLVEFSPTRYTVSEGDGVVTLTLTADSVADCNYTVEVRTQDGTATAPSDYLSLPYTATFLAGSTSATVDIILVQDDIYEANIGAETFTASISAIPAIGCSISAGPNRMATVSITDNEDLTVQFNPATYDVSESNGSVTLLLETDKQFQYPFTVNVGTADGTAVAPEDYVDGSYNVAFIPESTTAQLQVPIVNDTVCEDEEVFFDNIIIPTALVAVGVMAGPQNTATISIQDDDIAAVQFDPVQYRVREHDGNAVLQLASSRTCQFDYNVTVDVSNGTATVGSDFGSGPFTASFPAGSTTSSVNVPITDDQLQEGDETFAAQLQIQSNVPDTVVRGENAVAQVVIEDNEEVITINFNPARYKVSEDGLNVELTLVASRPSPVPYSITVNTMDGTAQGGSDFESQRYQVTFLVGETTTSVSIPITNDTTAEFTEDFSAVLTIPATATSQGITKGAADTATIDITDDDPVEVVFNPTQYTVNEGDGVVTLTLNADKPASFEYTVEVVTQDGTATAPSDYQPGPYSVTFPAGSTTAAVNITIESDSVLEGTENFTPTISTANTGFPSVTAGDDDTATINIQEDTSIQVTFSPTDYSVSEDAGNVVITLLANQPASFDYTVQVGTVDGAAVAGQDYTGGSYTATFLAGQTTTSVSIPITDDTTAELTEAFTAVLSIPARAASQGITKGAADTATIDIIDDDPVEVVFNPTQYTVNEGDGVVTLTLNADKPASFEYTVEVETQDGTATAPSDYQPGPYSVTFPPGSTTAAVNIIVIDDAVYEGSDQEAFTATISTANTRVSSISPGDDNTATISINENEDDMSNDALCPTDKDSVWGIQWLAIAAGSIQSARCPGEGSSSVDGLAYRRCMTGVPAEWGSVDASECESVAGRAVREKTDKLISSLEKSNGTNRNLTDNERNLFQIITHDLSAVLNPSDERNRSILPRDLKTAVKFVDVVADLAENNGLFREESNETEETVANILSNVLDEGNAPAFEATAQTDSPDPELGKATTPAVSILQSTERVANVIASTLSRTKPSFTIARPNLAINGQRFSFNNLHTGIVFPGAGISDTLASFRNLESLPQIHLPQSFLRAAKGIEEASLEDDTVEVVNVVMNNMENYLPSDVINQDKDVEDSPEETFPASRVISSQILGYSGGEVDSNERAEVTFPVNAKSHSLSVPPGKVKQFRCAFFNFTAEEANQTGGWSYRGVETDIINTTHVRCIASHLTSFMVLVSIVPSVGEPPALDYITYIGCSISLLCLLASIIFYLTLRKELIQKLHNFVHLNLCIALSLGLLLFLTGIQTATANIYACKVMTALLHYFFLATFTWTLCEAVLVYILLVKVFGANERKWIYLYLALGWVLPIPVVVITGGARHDYYLIRASVDRSHPHYSSIKACWLPSEKGVIFAFIGPMVAIILVNAVLLSISLVSLARSQCGRMSSRNDEKRQKYMKVGKQLLKATVILVPLLGFTWIIGLFAVGEEGRVFAYLFVIGNVFQGLFIFLLHVLRHEKVYGKIKDKLPNISKLVTAYTGSASSSAKSTHASTSDTRKVSFALESEAIIVSGVNKDEDAESIKDGGDQDIKLDVINEDVKDGEGNECEEAHVATALEMSAVTTGALEETEEKTKGDSTEDHAGQTCAVFTSGEQSGNEAGGVADTVC